ncbi:hypothetical protein [Lacrimispora amygdalina]|uniref:hypothetical protein n=1 Tax=Lacrimispora amygdalina TaxID=253257 RepID=UPI000BE39041|nr:hypothetical protein [Lacrimispora amygdalina]
MSYWFRMHFAEVEEKQFLDFCIKLNRACIEEADEIIMDNAHYIPSIQHSFGLLEESEYRENWREADRNWLYNLFSNKFVYWPDKGLVGAVGNFPSKIEKDLVTIEFQNSTDQNYDYEYWSGISYFEEITKLLKTGTTECILSHLNKGSVSAACYTLEEITEDIDYYKKSAVYNSIYNSLDLDNWLWNKKGDFRSFSIQAINSSEEHFQLTRKLEIVRKKKLEEYKEMLK